MNTRRFRANCSGFYFFSTRSTRRSSGVMGAIIALPVAFALIMATTNVYAARWFDDFNDGNALDGSPLAWSEHPALPGSYDASSGDYVLSGLNDANDGEFMFSAITTVTFEDVSVRVQGRVTGAGNLGVTARADFDTVTGYAALIDHNGQINLLAASDPFNPTSIGQDNSGIAATTDVILQLDVVGNLVTVTAWRPDDPMPTPQLSVFDTTFTDGVSGLVFAEDDNGSSGIYVNAESVTIVTGDTNRSGTVDRIDVATVVENLGTQFGVTLADGDVNGDGLVGLVDLAIVQSGLGAGASPSPVAATVPEPTTLTLATLGLLACAVMRRRRRR